MAPQELLLHVFCTIDDEIKALGGPPRRPGPRPRLADSEVITIEVVGELWGLADDAAILRHFRPTTSPSSPPWPASTGPASPATPPTSAGSSARSSAGSPGCWAAPGCTGWSTAARCRPAASAAPATAAGSRGPPPTGSTRWRARRSTASGSTSGSAPTGSSSATSWRRPTPTSWACARAGPLAAGVALGDRNYWSPSAREEFRAAGGDLVAPYKQGKHDPEPERSERLLAAPAGSRRSSAT